MNLNRKSTDSNTKQTDSTKTEINLNINETHFF